jgi:TRAP-type C4-dicarboxylate transport system permease small subunit
MTSVLDTLSALLRRLALASLWISGLGLVLMTAFVAWQVFGRYVLNDTPTWTEPLSIQLMGWFILLGAAVGVREDTHLGFEVARHYAPAPLAGAMILLSNLSVLFFGAAMAIYGVVLVQGTWTARLPVLGWPGGVDFMPLVAGGALIVLFACENILKLAVHGVPKPEVR